MNSEVTDKVPTRICFICPKAYPLFNPEVKEYFAGAEVDLYLLATELAKDRNFMVSFVTADYGQKPTETREAVTIIKGLDFSKNSLSVAIRIWQALRCADADIYMLKTASPGVPLVAVFCRIHHKIFAYRTASIPECDGTYLNQHFFLGRAFVWSLRQAKIIFAQNNSDKDDLKQTTGLDSVVIPNGHRISQPQKRLRDSILWVGRSDKVKGPGKFIELAQKFPQEKFVMICQQATGDRNYDRLCDEAKSVANIEFYERVPFHEVDRFFQQAKVLVNTSDFEGFSNTFIQACLCETAILSLNVNPDGFLNKYSCGSCCDGNEEQLPDVLKSLLAEDRYVQMGRNGRKYAEEKHDIKKIAEQYKELFFNLVHKPDTVCDEKTCP
jgi:glycosyltransferase involved in cell wall biosynthesis